MGRRTRWRRLRRTVTDRAGVSDVARTYRKIIGANPPPPVLPPASGALYGSRTAMDFLGNHLIGGPAGPAQDARLAYRFRAPANTTVVSTRASFPMLPQPNYSLGSPTIRVSVQADNGSGFPSGVDLRYQDITPSTAADAAGQSIRQL